jgi:hypothetical protein
MSEPVALRYEFDGNGYLYMDAGSGSDWASRVKDCEFLYTKPPTNAEFIAYCVDLEEDALIEASKILGLDPTDVNFLNTPLYTHPLTNAEPIAWVYPEFMKNIKDAKCWTAYATYHKDRPIPLYTHPMRELTDEEILKIYDEVYVKNHNNGIDFARAIIKASRGEK